MNKIKHSRDVLTMKSKNSKQQEVIKLYNSGKITSTDMYQRLSKLEETRSHSGDD